MQYDKHTQDVIELGFKILEDPQSTDDQRETAIMMICEFMNRCDLDDQPDAAAVGEPLAALRDNPYGGGRLPAIERHIEELIDRSIEERYEPEPDYLYGRF